MTRRRWSCLVGLVLVVAALGIGLPYALRQLGGAFDHTPAEMEQGLSADARRLVEQAFEGIDPQRLLDYHTHLIGLGTGGSGAFVSPEMRSWWHLTKRVRFEVYVSASGITDLADADRQYVDRLVDQVRHIPGHGRHLLLAFDKNHGPDGTPDLEHTEFYVPNAYAFEVAAAHPDLFVAAISVHPYRRDALAELDRWAGRGARIVKWLPNAMGIDPADARCDPYYAKMKELDLVLLTHAGEEQAVAGVEAQALGNPLRLRRALDAGVKVILAHCASLGQGDDLDRPGERRDNFDLFLRLMEEPRYEGLLFGEISALPQFNRLPRPLLTLLARKDLHPRLVNGSDYPIPAVNTIVRTRDLVALGLLTAEERRHLNEIYDFNPLLFDFVLKRTLKDPAGGHGFSPSVFLIRPALAPRR
ncbi:MAG: amidohydrolase family protein [Planctomycetota bacterium]|jgi:predicted TIM-barrel fold metal-dependent hydrolase